MSAVPVSDNREDGTMDEQATARDIIDAMRRRAMRPHDFKRDGSRTVRKLALGRWTLWLEESASWHLDGWATYGVALRRWDGWWLEVDAGRFSLHAALSKGGGR